MGFESSDVRGTEGLSSIASAQSLDSHSLESAVSLMFAAGARPCAADIRKLAQSNGQFGISIDPELDGDVDGGWVELLQSGLTFDLVGLEPGPASNSPDCVHRFAIENGPDLEELEVITLVPGPHIASGGTMFPVVRCLAVLGAQLAQLPGVQCVAWHAARACSAPDYFRDGVMRWIEGGAFLGLGLTALVYNSDGSLQSEGLRLFTGQDLRLAPEMCVDKAEAAKIALRLLNWLVEHGRIEQKFSFTGPAGETLELEPVDNSSILHVWKRSH